MKKTFFLKLNPPRPTFMLDMNKEERALMLQHIAYWKPYVDNGTMLAMGPVMDAKGGYGVGIIAVENEEELAQLIAADPANGVNQYEIHPMRVVSNLLKE
ncbi:MAG TPA: YciI family protein [Bacteroidia bacterium]|jgi:uncharacterized protein YciI